MKILNRENWKVPVYVFTENENIDNDIICQVEALAKSDIPYKHISLMPDFHQGYSVPIGTVFASENYVFPYAVGVDIGCGVRLNKFNIKTNDIKPYLKEILKLIKKEIPAGFEWRKKPVEAEFFKHKIESNFLKNELNDAKLQIGTLGGGNHFIEFQKDNSDNIYLMIHCGSRNIGKKTADYYHNIAVKRLSGNNQNLPVLNKSEEDGINYLKDMNWCLDFAYANRKLIGKIILKIISKFLNNVEIIQEWDIHHNYACFEKHYGKNLIVHRKGAVKADVSDYVLIPGSMGNESYFLEGLGFEKSFKSASHGAGRVLSRNQAKKKFNPKEIIKNLEKSNIEIETKNIKDIAEENGEAYKNIKSVLKNEKELVKVKFQLNPIAVFKG
ncbi:MAG: RtcB family protein [Candidatus Muiribacteriota bacterium]